MRRPQHPAAVPFLVCAIAIAAAACSGGGPGWTFGPPASISATSAGPSTATTLGAATPGPGPVYLSLTVLSDKQTGKVGWPVFLSSDFSLPANSTVVVTVTNFDNATPLPKGSASLAKATGIAAGIFTVTPIQVTDPNGSAGLTVTASALDPTKVSHTFTIPSLGINVPIAPEARTTFTIHTGNPCQCNWHCFVPCGTAPNGFGGPMAATSNYMEGVLAIG